MGAAAGQKVKETSKNFLLLPSTMEDDKRGNFPAKTKEEKGQSTPPAAVLFFFPLVNSSPCTLVEDFPLLFPHLKKKNLRGTHGAWVGKWTL